MVRFRVRYAVLSLSTVVTLGCQPTGGSSTGKPDPEQAETEPQQPDTLVSPADGGDIDPQPTQTETDGVAPARLQLASDVAPIPPVPAFTFATPTGPCPKLAGVPAGASPEAKKLVPAMEALRAFTCESPPLGESRADILKKIGAKDSGFTFTIRRRGLSVDLAEDVLVADVLAAAGLSGMQMKLHQGWGTSWSAADPKTKEAPTPWGVQGGLSVSTRGERYEDAKDGTLKPIEATMSAGSSFGIYYPADALSFEDDPLAAPVMASGLDAIATDPAVLRQTPEAASATLAVLGERFTLSPYSMGTGESKRSGFVVYPNRTELIASDFAQAMGWDDARKTVINITDVNPLRLEHADQTDIDWRGLTLEIELEKRAAGGLLLRGWVVDSILVLPAKPD